MYTHPTSVYMKKEKETIGETAVTVWSVDMLKRHELPLRTNKNGKRYVQRDAQSSTVQQCNHLVMHNLYTALHGLSEALCTIVVEEQPEAVFYPQTVRLQSPGYPLDMHQELSNVERVQTHYTVKSQRTYVFILGWYV